MSKKDRKPSIARQGDYIETAEGEREALTRESNDEAERGKRDREKMDFQRSCIMTIFDGSQWSCIMTIFNGVNVLAGAGLLSTPFAIKEAGWFSLVLLPLFAVLHCYTSNLVQYHFKSKKGIGSHADAEEENGIGSYVEVGEENDIENGDNVGEENGIRSYVEVGEENGIESYAEVGEENGIGSYAKVGEENGIENDDDVGEENDIQSYADVGQRVWNIRTSSLIDCLAAGVICQVKALIGSLPNILVAVCFLKKEGKKAAAWQVILSSLIIVFGILSVVLGTHSSRHRSPTAIELLDLAQGSEYDQ